MPVHIYLFITYVKSTRGNTRMINSWPLCSACALRKIPSGLSSGSGRTTQEGSCPAHRTDPPMLVLNLVVTHVETCVTGFEISLQFYTIRAEVTLQNSKCPESGKQISLKNSFHPVSFHRAQLHPCSAAVMTYVTDTSQAGSSLRPGLLSL